MFLLILIFTFTFILLSFFLLLVLRAYRVKMRITYPIRTIFDTEDYQDIFVILLKLNSLLKSRKIKDNFLGRFWAKLNKINFIRLLTFRPLTYDWTKFHLSYAFANLSEVSRDKFRKSPDSIPKLKHVFSSLITSIYSENHKRYCYDLAQYYRLLRAPEVFNNKYFNDDYEINKELTKALEEIKDSLKENDTFLSYNYLLPFHNKKYLKNLNDLEVLAVFYLSAKLESFIQGSFYYINREDIKTQIDEIINKCEIIKKALLSKSPTKLLLVAA